MPALVPPSLPPCSTRKGGFLTSGTNFRLFQLICSVFILLFSTASVIQVGQRLV